MRIVLAIATFFAVLFVLLIGAFLLVTRGPEGVRTTLVPPKKDVKTAWYVAIGDSYTAAPELVNQISVSTPTGCDQSDANYPHIVAEHLKVESLTDMSCSGAFTKHLTSAQWTNEGTNQPQEKALSAQTKLVTIGLGGNDSKLLPLFFECAGKPHDAANPSFCVQKFRSGGQNKFVASVKSVRPDIDEMLDVVREKAPNAEAYVVGYPQITPDDGTDCPDEMPFTARDLAYLDEGIVALNAELRSAAAKHKMFYVDTHKPSEGLGVCAPRDRRWIESVVPTAPAFAMHPNPVGELGIAEAVLKRYEKVHQNDADNR
jgi:lysophospholipase L1-like esterase